MRTGRGLAVLLVVIQIAFPLSAAAWGKFGHLTVCDLAYRNLTPDSRTALRALMHSQTGGITVKGRGKLPDRTYTSFNLGCLEEDELPRKHAADHFINVERTTTAITQSECPAQAECILAGIQRDFDTLKDASKSDEERVFALMALGHWIGDIHQPLHVSFADDRGGNSIRAKMTAKCGSSGYRPDNLHAVWDNCLLETGVFERVRRRADFRKTWAKHTITYRAVDTLLANTTLTEEKSFLGGQPWVWANESYAITREADSNYCVMQANACQYSAEHAMFDAQHARTQTVDAAYLTTFAPVVQERLRRAGFRLADLLNQALDPHYTGPVANGMQKP